MGGKADTIAQPSSWWGAARRARRRERHRHLVGEGEIHSKGNSPKAQYLAEDQPTYSTDTRQEVSDHHHQDDTGRGHSQPLSRSDGREGEET